MRCRNISVKNKRSSVALHHSMACKHLKSQHFGTVVQPGGQGCDVEKVAASVVVES